MSLVISEEQKLLQETAREFVSSKSSLRRIRALRDAADPLGFSRDLWREMAALGWAGIALPEAYGGSGLGQRELMVVLEALGAGLMPEPMISTVLLGANAVLLAGSEAQKRALLPGVIAGETLLALAWQESRGRYDAFRIATRATPAGGGFRLSGEKILVLDGAAADRIVVSARTSGKDGERGGIGLFAVDPRSPGVTLRPQTLVDSRRAAVLRLDDVAVDSQSALGDPAQGGGALEETIDRATAGLCADMLGAMTVAFETTVEYLKTRKQFGVLIGTFQGLKHRAARVYVETELARSAVLAAHAALDERAENARDLVSIAKARVSDAFRLAANEAVQMHGGIGMTDEHDIGFFLKRAKTTEMMFGDAAWHRRRFAERHGY